MNGTVALAVPPIKTGLRPSSAVIGAVATDVTNPKTGGRPIMLAIARPYGRAIRAAIAPPPKSPANSFQLYRKRNSRKNYTCVSKGATAGFQGDERQSNSRNEQGYG